MKKMILLCLLVLGFSANATSVSYTFDEGNITVDENGYNVDGDYESWNMEEGFTVIAGGYRKGVKINNQNECLQLTYTDYSQFLFWAFRSTEVKKVTFCKEYIKIDSKESNWLYWVIPVGDHENNTETEEFENLDFRALKHLLSEFVIDLV